MRTVPADPVVTHQCVWGQHNSCPEPRRCECRCHFPPSATTTRTFGLASLLRRMAGAR